MPWCGQMRITGIDLPSDRRFLCKTNKRYYPLAPAAPISAVEARSSPPKKFPRLVRLLRWAKETKGRWLNSRPLQIEWRYAKLSGLGGVFAWELVWSQWPFTVKDGVLGGMFCLMLKDTHLIWNERLDKYSKRERERERGWESTCLRVPTTRLCQ